MRFEGSDWTSLGAAGARETRDERRWRGYCKHRPAGRQAVGEQRTNERTNERAREQGADGGPS